MVTLRLVALAVLLLLAGCGDVAGPQPTSSVRGIVLLVDRSGIDAVGAGAQGYYCQGRGAYADLVRGARVEVRDSNGHPVRGGRLGLGRMTVDLARLGAGGSAAGVDQGCLIGFAVDRVPPAGRNWSVRIGRHTFALPPVQQGEQGEQGDLNLTVG